MAKSGGRKRRPQGCSLRSHRLRRLKPLTPTLSPATHSAMPSMLPCCTSDLKRREEKMRNRKILWHSLYAAAVAILVASTAAAQQPGRIRGQIEKADGTILSVKTRDGKVLKVNVDANTRVSALVKACLPTLRTNPSSALPGCRNRTAPSRHSPCTSSCPPSAAWCQISTGLGTRGQEVP